MAAQQSAKEFIHVAGNAYKITAAADRYRISGGTIPGEYRKAQAVAQQPIAAARGATKSLSPEKGIAEIPMASSTRRAAERLAMSAASIKYLPVKANAVYGNNRRCGHSDRTP